MRGYLEPVNLLQGFALNVGGKTTISDPLPMGEGWYKAYLRINIALTIGTGAGAITEGELLFIKNILFRTDRGEIVCNVPGRGLYKIATYKAGSPPAKDAIAAATATYTVTLPLFFADYQKYVDRPEDTILDTSRYSACFLEITLGGVADLLTTVGTSSVTATLDLEVFRVKGRLPSNALPQAHISYNTLAPVDASVIQQILIERAADLAMKRLYLHTCTGGVAGVPFSGVNSDAIINVLQVKDQSGFISKDRIWAMIQRQDKDFWSLETLLSGYISIDFIQDGSHQAALATAGKSLLQFSWTNQGGVAASSLVTCCYEGYRSLK